MGKRNKTHIPYYAMDIKQHIKNQDWEALNEIMSLLQEHGPGAKRYLRLGWLHLGDHYFSDDRVIDAIVAYNFARAAAVNDKTILRKLFESLEQFYEAAKSDLSREDLLALGDSLERILNFYRVGDLWDSQPIQIGNDLLRKLQSMIEDAPSLEETRATFSVKKIYSAIYDNMTIQEVRAEFARLLEPTFRDLLEEEEEKPKKKKKAAKKKRKPPE